MDIVHVEEQGFCLATRGCLIVATWGREVILEDLERFGSTQRRVIAALGRCVAISIIRAKPTLGVGPEIRAASSENLREHTERKLASALVVESGGAQAIFFRSVITSVNLLARTSIPQKVFTTIDDAVGWVLTRPGIDPATTAATAQIIAEVREFADRHVELRAR